VRTAVRAAAATVELYEVVALIEKSQGALAGNR